MSWNVEFTYTEGGLTSFVNEVEGYNFGSCGCVGDSVTTECVAK